MTTKAVTALLTWSKAILEVRGKRGGALSAGVQKHRTNVKRRWGTPPEGESGIRKEDGRKRTLLQLKEAGG